MLCTSAVVNAKTVRAHLSTDSRDGRRPGGREVRPMLPASLGAPSAWGLGLSAAPLSGVPLPPSAANALARLTCGESSRALTTKLGRREGVGVDEGPSPSPARPGPNELGGVTLSCRMPQDVCCETANLDSTAT